MTKLNGFLAPQRLKFDLRLNMFVVVVGPAMNCTNFVVGLKWFCCGVRIFNMAWFCQLQINVNVIT